METGTGMKEQNSPVTLSSTEKFDKICLTFNESSEIEDMTG